MCIVHDHILIKCYVRFAYVRMICMDHILRKFIEETQHGGQIISFGAGFDTAYFRLKEALGRDICFVEVYICIYLFYPLIQTPHLWDISIYIASYVIYN